MLLCYRGLSVARNFVCGPYFPGCTKPFSFERFMQAVNRVQASYSNVISVALMKEVRKIFLRVDKRQVHVDVSQIQCLESYGNYVKVWLENEMLLTPKTLSSFENELQGLDFQRVHKSFIVNRKVVDYVEGHTIFLKIEKGIPVGKNFRGVVMAWFY